MTKRKNTEKDVENHIKSMTAFMRLVNDSNIPKRDAEKITSWFEALANVDRPDQLDTLLQLMAITRLTTRELYDGAIENCKAKRPCTPEQVEVMQRHFKQVHPFTRTDLSAAEAYVILDRIDVEELEAVTSGNSLHNWNETYVIDGVTYDVLGAFGEDGTTVSIVEPYIWSDPNAC